MSGHGGSEALQAIRARIDALDAGIQRLITQRAELALEVARAKQAGAEEGGHFYRPEREAGILHAVRQRNAGPLSDAALTAIYRELISACLNLQQPLTVAYFGPEGTYTHAAALRHFGQSASYRPLPAIDEVFREVEAGGAQVGVVPVENSTEGMVSHTLDMFMASALHICGEIELRVHHNLLASNTDRAGLHKVLAHPQTFAQCREWLNRNCPHAERVPVSSNGEAARLAAQDAGLAAIASETAASTYGLALLERNIEDHPDNTTRFLVIGARPVPPSGRDKTSLLLAARNKPGALYHLLSPLADAGLNLTRIESRPARRSRWEYVFFVDLEGHASDANVATALQALQAEASSLRVLGSYPRAIA
jgi:chorismate mutase/prephenate dehydratase